MEVVFEEGGMGDLDVEMVVEAKRKELNNIRTRYL